MYIYIFFNLCCPKGASGKLSHKKKTILIFVGSGFSEPIFFNK